MKVVSEGELTLEAMPDAPDAEYLRTFLEHYNSFRRNTTEAMRKKLNLADNLSWGEQSYDLTHNTEVKIANPLAVPIKGVWALQCEGLTLDSQGRPTGAVYSLDTPVISWRPSGAGDGAVFVKANYSRSNAGLVGESSRSAIASGSAVSLTTATAANVTSLSLGAGEWDICGLVVNGGSPTGFTELAGAVNTTSANIGTSGDNQGLCVLAGGIPTITSIAVPPRRYTLTATATVYLVARAVFSGGTCTAYGRIEAVRAAAYNTGVVGRVNLLFYGG